MAQQTALSVIALPGRVHTFTAKEASVFYPAAERTYQVSAESRITWVFPEDRIYHIPAEDRTVKG